jgi:sulfoxide reductase catalytic subunit YedY
MTMLIKRPSDIAPSSITPREVYLRRREFMAGAAGLALAAVAPTRAGAAPLTAAKSPLSTTDEPSTPVKDITSYNNFYEFGVDKGDPAKNAHTLTTKPWTVKIDGMVGKPPTTTSRTSSTWRPWRSACIACAAWKAGRW